MFRKLNPAVGLDCVDSNVKASLILRLKECVSEIVMKYTAESWIPLKNEEATNMLCWILEAVFIHGLKNTFIKSLFTSRRENAIPNPSFWEFVMIFSHRDVIEQIRKLNYVNNDVGRGRAWIRITLNEMSLVSYLENMFKNPTYVRSFYKPSAFLRDSEKCDILKNYLVGVVESCKFELVVDNSLLNNWTSGPLSLVGLWMDDNISLGIDAAKHMDSKDLQAIPKLGKARTPVPDFMRVLQRPPLLAEEDALRIIMASKPSSSSNAASAASSRRNSSDSNQYGKEPIIITTVVPSISNYSIQGTSKNKIVEAVEPTGQDQQPFAESTTIPNKKTNDNQCLPHKIIIEDHIPVEPIEQQQRRKEVLHHSSTLTQPSPPFSEPMDIVPVVGSHERDTQIHDDSSHNNMTNKSEELSYIELLAAYNKDKKIGAEIYSGSPMDSHLEELMKTTNSDNSDNMGSSEKATSSVEVDPIKLHEDGFEVICTFNSNKHSSEMYPRIQEFVGKIANEIGMDVQQYSCKFCRAPIGMSFAPARVCHFTGNYFCNSCHLLETNVIPSRILLNWDFSLYSVCKLSHEFLEEIKDQPLFDLDRINPKLYLFIDELAELRDLRIKLNFISMYLKTCKDESVLAEFQKEIWPREHLFEAVNLYSLSDLLSVASRALTAPMKKLLKFGKAHIISCKICKAKGFVCEVCRNPEVIFPFNLESIFKCRSCGAVYHKNCMNHSKPCPRCIRWTNTPQNEEDEICDDDDDNS